ncbi:MAG: hypothetical protein HY670_06470 [Chloroflexi bacterium]|nr:hypothetical protein [Chloroflexota bacterium]
MDQVNSILILVLIIIAAIAAIIFIPRWRLQRAMKQVIRIFRHFNATDAKNAKTLDEMGLAPRSFLQSAFRGRDYKQYALTFLRSANILLLTDEGKVYLSEERVSSTGLDKRLGLR